MNKKVVYTGVVVALLGGATVAGFAMNQPKKEIKVEKKVDALAELEKISKNADYKDIKKLDADIVKAQEIKVSKDQESKKSKIIDDMKSKLVDLVKNDAKKLAKGDDVTKVNEELDKLTKKVNELKSLSKDDIKKLVAEINKMKPTVPETSKEQSVEENVSNGQVEEQQQQSVDASVSHSEAPQAVETQSSPQPVAPTSGGRTNAPVEPAPAPQQNVVPESKPQAPMQPTPAPKPQVPAPNQGGQHGTWTNGTTGKQTEMTKNPNGSINIGGNNGVTFG